MIELGKKWPKPEPTMAPNKAKSEIHYPYLSIDKDLGLSEKDAGKTIYARVKLYVKEVSKRVEKRAGEDTKKTERSEFDVQAIEIEKKLTREGVGQSLAEEYLKK